MTSIILMIFIALIAVTTVQIMKFNHFKQDRKDK